MGISETYEGDALPRCLAQNIPSMRFQTGAISRPCYGIQTFPLDPPHQAVEHPTRSGFGVQPEDLGALRR